MDTGSVTNIATAMATDPLGNNVTSAHLDDDRERERGDVVAYRLAKSTTTSAFSKAGQSIDYDYLVTNTGTTTISPSRCQTTRSPPSSCPTPSLAPGASETCTGAYVTTQSDVDNGAVTNIAYASGLPPASLRDLDRFPPTPRR